MLHVIGKQRKKVDVVSYTAFNKIAKQFVYNHWTGLEGWTGRLEWWSDILCPTLFLPNESVTKLGISKCSGGIMLSADLSLQCWLERRSMFGVQSVHMCRTGFQALDLLTQFSICILT